MLLHGIHLDLVRALNEPPGYPVSLDFIPVVFWVILDLAPVIFPVISHFVVANGGPPLATTNCVMATGGAAMGSAVATGGLPWVVSTGFHHLLRLLRGGG